MRQPVLHCVLALRPQARLDCGCASIRQAWFHLLPAIAAAASHICLCTCRLAFVGFTMAAQVTGKGPLAALSEHLADPINTTIFSK